MIGNGNVALDVARMLALTRGGARARPTRPTRRSTAIVGVGHPRDRRPRPARPRAGRVHAARARRARRARRRRRRSSIRPSSSSTRRARPSSQAAPPIVQRNVEILREFAAREPGGQAARGPAPLPRLAGRDPRRRSGRGDRGRPQRARGRRDGRSARSRPTSARSIPCGIVFRSVGYRGVAASRASRSTRRAARSRTTAAACSTPTARRSRASTAPAGSSAARRGVIGTNKKDATETVELLLEDARAGRLPARGRARPIDDAARRARRRRSSRYAGWEAIDAAERARGEPQGRPRVKLCELGRAARRGPPVSRARGTHARARRTRARLGAMSGDGRTAGALGRRDRARRSPTSPSPASRSPSPVARWLGRIKAAAARVNADLELLDRDMAERIAAAADRVAAGEFDDQFPIDVFQTGSGTSSNMNANEVIAALAGDDVHANDHVNMGQSSNDVFPSAVHLRRARRDRARPAPGARAPGRLARAEGLRVRRRRQVRPHALDGRGARDARARSSPATRRRCARGSRASRTRCRASARSRSAAPRPAPASTRTPSSPRASREYLSARDRPRDLRPRRPLRGAGGPRRPRRGLGRAQGRRRLADEDRERPPLHGLRAARRARRALPARAAEGLVDHARQGQPGHPRGRDAGRGAGDRQRRRDHDRRHERATSSSTSTSR